MEKSRKPSMVALLRQIRDEMNAEWDGLTWEERRRRTEADLADDPVWQRWLRKDADGGEKCEGNGLKP